MDNAPEITDVRAAHKLDEARLSDYLSKHLEGFSENLRVRQFEGGQSNPTYLLQDDHHQWVLRKKPPGELLKSAHQVEREYRVMHALAGTEVPVPRVDLLCEDDSIIGTPFFVMDMIPGRIIMNPLEGGLEPAHLRALYEDFIGVLASLHNVDYGAVGLAEGFGRPGNYFERQISRWSRQYRASETQAIPEMDRLIEWLPEHIPQDDVTSIVHGDFSIRNMVVHESEAKVRAVLDWELSTIGHPLGDLGQVCYIFHFPDSSEEALRKIGVPAEEELIQLYCDKVGRDEIEGWPFYIAYSLFRLAAISQGVYKRGLDGNAASDRALDQMTGVLRSADAGWEVVEGWR